MLGYDFLNPITRGLQNEVRCVTLETLKKDNMTLDTHETSVNGDTVSIDFWYPRQRAVKFIKIGLIDVRAADDIRISYDFERDGYKIEQASKFEWTEFDEDPLDHDWQEVAFVGAWGRKR